MKGKSIIEVVIVFVLMKLFSIWFDSILDMHSDRCWQWHLNKFLGDRFVHKPFYCAVINAALLCTAGTMLCDFTDFFPENPSC